MRKEKTIYSEFATARASAIAIHVGSDSKAGGGVESFLVENRGGHGCPDWRLLAWANWRRAH